MNTTALVQPSLDKAQRDLEEAANALASVWVADDHAAVGLLTNGAEALMRAIASVTLAVERIAEFGIEQLERDIAREVVDRQDSIRSVRAALRDQISEVYP
jgi:ribosomal protein S11